MIDIINYIPKNSKILKSEIIEKFKSKFVRIIFEITDDYMEKYDLDYKKRYVDILLVPSKEYSGYSVMSAAYTENK